MQETEEEREWRAVQGEIIQVQGGHIVRSIGRKDRHSKVYTSKGPRDRRVRLSAHTAIQFYDVQDRLGYDRPSKAVDWLMKKAKSAIDKLSELPPCYPNPNPSEMGVSADQSESSEFNFETEMQFTGNPHNDSNFVTPSLDSDTMRTFFPTSTENSSMNFQSYSVDIINHPNQDLGLSLQSFQDTTNHTSQNDDHNFFAGSEGFEAGYQKMISWNNDMGSQPFLGQSSAAFSQRGPLQSSFANSMQIRDWSDLSIGSDENRRTDNSVHHSSVFGTRFVSDGLPDFCIPARIQCVDVQGTVLERPSSSSSPNSLH